LNVPGNESVQPASFAGGSSGTLQAPAGTTSAPSTYGGGSYDSGSYGGGSYAPAPQTATQGSGTAYPDTYRR
jgi:hypothetical protein